MVLQRVLDELFGRMHKGNELVGPTFGDVGRRLRCLCLCVTI